MANLKGMSVAELLTLRSDVDTMLVSRRDELHAQLAEIGGNNLDFLIANAAKKSAVKRSKAKKAKKAR